VQRGAQGLDEQVHLVGLGQRLRLRLGRRRGSLQQQVRTAEIKKYGVSNMIRDGKPLTASAHNTSAV
jgi:hypothetical protein